MLVWLCECTAVTEQWANPPRGQGLTGPRCGGGRKEEGRYIAVETPVSIFILRCNNSTRNARMLLKRTQYYIHHV